MQAGIAKNPKYEYYLDQIWQGCEATQCLPLRPKQFGLKIIDIRKIDINSVVSAGVHPVAREN